MISVVHPSGRRKTVESLRVHEYITMHDYLEIISLR